jgi:subtilisin-like proprotein convertase family protein
MGTGLPTALPATGTSGSLESFSTEAPAGVVVDLRVTVTLDHNCTKDLSASLVSPEGSSVLLFDMAQYVVCSANMENTQFDDSATSSILSAFKPFTGLYQPAEPLSKFKGEQGGGVWKLQLYDDTIGDSGKLKSWSVDLIMDSVDPGT